MASTTGGDRSSLGRARHPTSPASTGTPHVRDFVFKAQVSIRRPDGNRGSASHSVLVVSSIIARRQRAIVTSDRQATTPWEVDSDGRRLPTDGRPSLPSRIAHVFARPRFAISRGWVSLSGSRCDSPDARRGSASSATTSWSKRTCSRGREARREGDGDIFGDNRGNRYRDTDRRRSEVIDSTVPGAGIEPARAVRPTGF